VLFCILQGLRLVEAFSAIAQLAVPWDTGRFAQDLPMNASFTMLSSPFHPKSDQNGQRGSWIYQRFSSGCGILIQFEPDRKAH